MVGDERSEGGELMLSRQAILEVGVKTHAKFLGSWYPFRGGQLRGLNAMIGA